MSSASPVPMWCTSISENRLAVFSLSAVVGDLPVVSDGVWHNAQPTEFDVNNARPLLMEAEQAGSGASPHAGVGGARNRMKFAKAMASLMKSCGGPDVKLVWSSEVG